MIIFRVDGNAQIGAGHVMRCLSLADAFTRCHEKCRFVLADDSFQKLIEERSYPVGVLGTDYRNTDGEIGILQNIIASFRPSMLILDSYNVTREYLEKLKKLVFLVYIDDLASFAYPVDVLVNYNVNGPWIDYKNMYLEQGLACPYMLLGVTYAPLRDMFRIIPKRKQKKRVKNILISTGGTDLLHLALNLVRFIVHENAVASKGNKSTSLSANNNKSVLRNYHFLVGPVNPDYIQIKRIADKNDNIQVHFNVKDMKTLISSCDLVVSAAGSTMYEVAACGVPMIIYVLAENQIPGAKAFEKLGLAVSCGDLRFGSAIDRIMNAVDLLTHNYTLREMIADRMQTFVDGHGADRLVDKLLILVRSRL